MKETTMKTEQGHAQWDVITTVLVLATFILVLFIAYTVA